MVLGRIYGSYFEHFGQKMDSLLLEEYWCNSHFLAKFMAQSWAAINQAQDHKWPIPLDSLLAGSVSPTYQNLSPIAHHISPGQASKDGRLEEILYMKYALMQQPSHIYWYNTKHEESFWMSRSSTYDIYYVLVLDVWFGLWIALSILHLAFLFFSFYVSWDGGGIKLLPMWRCSARRRLDGDLQTFCTILHRSAPAPAPHLGGYIGTGCRADNRAAQLLE